MQPVYSAASADWAMYVYVCVWLCVLVRLYVCLPSAHHISAIDSFLLYPHQHFQFFVPIDHKSVVVPRHFCSEVWEFFTSSLACGLSLEPEWQFPCIPLSILTDFNIAMVWVVLILPLVSNSSSLFPKTSGTVPRAPTIIIITFTFSQFFFTAL